MFDGNPPALTFSSLKYGERDTPYDLRVFLYRGGADANRRCVASLIDEGKLGSPVMERAPILAAIHQEMDSSLVAGGRRGTLVGTYRVFNEFIEWVDKEGEQLDLASVRQVYARWTEFLLHRQRAHALKASTVYMKAHQIGLYIDRILDRKPGMTLGETRVKFGWNKKRVLGTEADKQNLSDTFAFGHMLLDFTDSLTVEAIFGPLPVLIRLRSGKRLELWGSLRRPTLVKALSRSDSYEKRQVERVRAMYSADTALATRYSFVNFRIEAELLIFIAQTSMNLAQARRLIRGQFTYQSHFDGYQVRRLYKNRKKGEVEFEIYGAYREHFERYLAWTRTLPDDGRDLLFPFVAKPGTPLDETREFVAVRSKCKALGVPYVGPQKLRATRVNWLLRKSRDPALTAEMSQHTQETLLKDYERPHHQVAIVEISRFLSATDPAIAPPGPGACVKAIPSALPGISRTAPQPDCASPAGCLFCAHHRDIDSADHVWSLCSYRYLKTLEIARLRPTTASASSEHPAMAVLERLDDKLKQFQLSSDVRHLWVREAHARVAEGEHHPRWDGFIALAELK